MMQDPYTILTGAQTFAVVSVLALLLLWEGAHPFFDHFRQDARDRRRHALRNLFLGALNAALIAAVFAGLWVTAARWVALNGVGLLHVLSAAGLPSWAHAVGAVLLLDAWTYLWHRMSHRIPFLWRFHRVHHADRHVDVTTASRIHAGEIVASSLLRVPIIFLLGLYAWELVLYETLMFVVVQLHHANVVLPRRLDRALRLVIVTPSLHKVHHSAWTPETDSNYGALFSFWDRAGRSLRLREDLTAIRFGLDDEPPAQESVFGLVKDPFTRAHERTVSMRSWREE